MATTITTLTVQISIKKTEAWNLSWCIIQGLHYIFVIIIAYCRIQQIEKFTCVTLFRYCIRMNAQTKHGIVVSLHSITVNHTHTAEERIWDRWNREWNISTNDNCKLEALQNIVSSFAYGMKKVNVIDLFKYIECVCCVEHPASTQTQPLYSQPRFIVAIWQ